MTKCDNCRKEIHESAFYFYLWNRAIFCSVECRNIYVMKLINSQTEIRKNCQSEKIIIGYVRSIWDYESTDISIFENKDIFEIMTNEADYINECRDRIIAEMGEENKDKYYTNFETNKGFNLTDFLHDNYLSKKVEIKIKIIE